MSRLAANIRVLNALMIREMITRYGRSPAGYLWAVLEPAAFIGLLSVLFSQLTHTPPLGKSFPLFYATGYVAFHWVLDISTVTARSVHVNRPLLAFPAVTALDTVIARFILQSLTGLVVAVVVFGSVLLVFPDQIRLQPLSLLTAWSLASVLGLGLGLANCWLFAASQTWELVWGILSRPLFLISCVFFTFESLPSFVREILWWNPVVHVVGLVRTGFYPIYDAAYVAPGFPGALALGLSVFGLLAIRMAPARLVSP